jgi:hypothetical protein
MHQASFQSQVVRLTSDVLRPWISGPADVATRQYAQLAEEAGMSLTELSVRWCRQRAGVTTTLLVGGGGRAHGHSPRTRLILTPRTCLVLASYSPRTRLVLASQVCMYHSLLIFTVGVSESSSRVLFVVAAQLAPAVQPTVTYNYRQ